MAGHPGAARVGLEPEQWIWSSYGSYAHGEAGAVSIINGEEQRCVREGA
jgi:hypothetical protein